MSLPLRDSNATTIYGTGSITIDVDTSSGDLIVVFIGCINSSDYCNGVSDDIGNSYTIRTAVFSGDGDKNLVFAYCLSSIGTDASNTITATFSGSNTCKKNACAFTFIPSGTVSLDASTNKSAGYEGSPWESDSDLTTSETDAVVIAGFESSTSISYSNHEIPSGIAADGVESNSGGDTAFYRILSSIITNEEAEVDSSGGQYYAVEVLAFKNVAGGGAYNLPIDSGSLSLSGTATALLADRVISSISGNLSLAGSAISLLADRKIDSVSGNISLSGSIIGLIADRKVDIGSGILNLSGTTIDLITDRKLAAIAGALTLSGNAINLEYGYKLGIESGAITLTGSAISLLADRKLSIESGSIILSGTAINLLYGGNVVLDIESGTLSLAGSDINLKVTRKLPIASGALILSGIDLALLYSGLVLYARLTGEISILNRIKGRATILNRITGEMSKTATIRGRLN